MRILICELKKIWNWRLLLVIMMLAAITWFAFLNNTIGEYNQTVRYDSFSSYQSELFRLYGGTIKSKELVEAFVEERLAPIDPERNIIIANNPIFAKYGITDLTEFYEWFYNEESYSLYKGYEIYQLYANTSKKVAKELGIPMYNPGTPEELEEHIIEYYGGFCSPEEAADRHTMEAALTMLTMGKQYSLEWLQNSLQHKEEGLNTLSSRYVTYSVTLALRMQDKSPVIARAAERILAAGNGSLINYYLMGSFTLYAAITGVFALVAVIVLITPLLIADRSRRVNLLQYSSVVGRKIFHFQFVASIISAFVLSVVLTVLSFIPFIARVSEYWDVSIMIDGQGGGMWLYNITFGQFVFILAGMIIILCVGAACVVFILARFSTNIVNVVIKTIPVVIALSAVCYISVNKALSEYNIVFRQIFNSKFDVPEVITCFVIGVLGVIVAAAITAREKRVDMM